MIKGTCSLNVGGCPLAKVAFQLSIQLSTGSALGEHQGTSACAHFRLRSSNACVSALSFFHDNRVGSTAFYCFESRPTWLFSPYGTTDYVIHHPHRTALKHHFLDTTSFFPPSLRKGILFPAASRSPTSFFWHSSILKIVWCLFGSIFHLQGSSVPFCWISSIFKTVGSLPLHLFRPQYCFLPFPGAPPS